jgi:ribonuclease HI
MQNWKQNGWVKAGGKPVINRQQLEILDEVLKEVQVKWVSIL